MKSSSLLTFTSMEKFRVFWFRSRSLMTRSTNMLWFVSVVKINKTTWSTDSLLQPEQFKRVTINKSKEKRMEKEFIALLLFPRRWESKKNWRKSSSIRSPNSDATCMLRDSHQLQQQSNLKLSLLHLETLKRLDFSHKVKTLFMPLSALEIQTMLQLPRQHFTTDHSMESNCSSTTMRSRKSENSSKKMPETKLTSSLTRSNFQTPR